MDDRMMWAMLDAHWLPLFALVVCRLGGVAAIAPWGDSQIIAPRWRWLLVVLLALVVTPSLASSALDRAPLPREPVTLAWAALNELALGAVSGLALRLVAQAITWTVQLIGPLAGLTLADVFDPSPSEAPQVLGKLILGCVMATWLTVGGHRQVMAGILETLHVAPVGTVHVDGVTVSLVAELLGQSCLAGFRAAAPLVMALLAVWLVVGGMTRLAPRGVAWMWAASLASVLGLAGLSLTLDNMTGIYQHHLGSTMDRVQAEWHRAAQTDQSDVRSDNGS